MENGLAFLGQYVEFVSHEETAVVESFKVAKLKSVLKTGVSPFLMGRNMRMLHFRENFGKVIFLQNPLTIVRALFRGSSSKSLDFGESAFMGVFVDVETPFSKFRFHYFWWV